MNAVFLASFLKDIKKLRDPKLRNAIEHAIKDVEQSHSIDAIRAIKRLSGHRDYYRTRHILTVPKANTNGQHSVKKHRKHKK